MKFFLSLAAIAVAMSAPTTVVATAQLRRTLDSTVALAGPGSSSSNNTNEMCISTGEAPLSKSKAALMQGLANLLVAGGGSNKSGPRTNHPPPAYVFGCGWLDLDCYECEFCQEIYSLLLETGSETACDAICVATAEGAGVGPEDLVADAVALECVPLCEAIFSAVGDGTAYGACSFADLC